MSTVGRGLAFDLSVLFEDLRDGCRWTVTGSGGASTLAAGISVDRVTAVRDARAELVNAFDATTAPEPVA